MFFYLKTKLGKDSLLFGRYNCRIHIETADRKSWRPRINVDSAILKLYRWNIVKGQVFKTFGQVFALFPTSKTKKYEPESRSIRSDSHSKSPYVNAYRWTEKFSEAFRSAKATYSKNPFLFKYGYCYLKKAIIFFEADPH